MEYKKTQKIELYNDHFQNYKKYNVRPAQLVIADIPYNLGNNAYASSPQWYKDGDNKNGESKLANKEFFDTDKDFRIAEFFHFCSRLLIKEPKETGKSPAMIVFCAFEQLAMVKEFGEKHGFIKSYPLVFIKNYSSQVLKANMKIVGATEYALVLYRDKLPKFNNGCQLDENNKKIAGTGKMIFNWFNWERDNKKEYPKIHPTQKPIKLLKKLIEIFTDEGDVVIDPVAGSSSTLRACAELNRSSYGFEIKKEFCLDARDNMLKGFITNDLDIKIYKSTGKYDTPIETSINTEIKQEVEVIQETKNDIHICECGGTIKKTASGRCCEWCLKDY